MYTEITDGLWYLMPLSTIFLLYHGAKIREQKTNV
jgi:hypothetical protein